MIIALDCDEVLACFIDGINAYHNRVHGTALRAADYASTHFAKVPGWGSDAVADDKVQAFFRGSPEWLNLAPVPGARAALLALKAAHPALDLQVVTARSRKQEADTQKWLAEHFAGVFSRVHFLSAYDNAARVDAPARSKGEVCRELGALALVDDSPTYCVTASPHVPLVVLFSRVPWNSGSAAWEHPALPSNVVRALDWAAAGALLARLCAAVARAAPAGARAAAPPQPLRFVPAPPPWGAAALRAAEAAWLGLPACLPGGGAGAGGGAAGGAAADGAGAGGAAAAPRARAAELEAVRIALEVLEGCLRVRLPADGGGADDGGVAAALAAGIVAAEPGGDAGDASVVVLRAKSGGDA
jgi:hypothetical protein